MSDFDVTAAAVLKGTILPLLLGFTLLVLFLKNIKTLRNRFFAWVFSKYLLPYMKHLVPYKSELFASLQDFRSLDRDLRNKGLLRILEVGIGPGTNFQFYPKNARLVALDPNPFFEKELLENIARFPEIKLEKVIVSGGENMSQVEDNSVDVVVTTAVMCSMKDVDAFMREVHRVLSPGGKYFFLEHTVAYDTNYCHRIFLKVANLFWPLAFNGCQLTRDIDSAVRSAAGFEDIRLKRFVPDMMPKLIKFLIGCQIFGIVQKKKKMAQ